VLLVYSRASTLILDDILSAVDSHTAAAIVRDCFQGPLMENRTVILVSHHVQLVSPVAAYIVALDNGDVSYAGDRSGFIAGGFMEDLDKENEAEMPGAHKDQQDAIDAKAKNRHLALSAEASEPASETTSLAETTTAVDDEEKETQTPPERKAPRKLVEEEKRATGQLNLYKFQSRARLKTALCVLNRSYWLEHLEDLLPVTGFLAVLDHLRLGCSYRCLSAHLGERMAPSMEFELQQSRG
jgi:ABC-type proline/glycine betaine transport system ATPase subunit